VKFLTESHIESHRFKSNLYVANRIAKTAQIAIQIPIAIGICPSPRRRIADGKDPRPWTGVGPQPATIRGGFLVPPSPRQYNLVPAKGRWCSAAGEVTVGLVESKAAYRRVYGLASVTCGLTAEDQDQLRNT